MEMPLFLRFVFAVVVALPIALLSSDAGAIPVFARKYQTACTTCHYAAFPQLNAFGNAFRDRGYRIPPDDEVYVKDTPVSMGVEPWKKLFPHAVWPSDMPGLPPLSIVAFSNFTYNPHRRTHTGETGFDGIGEVELLTSGTYGESLSFFGALGLYGRNDFTPSRTELERMFFIYSPQFRGLAHHVNFQVGRFEPRAAPFRDHVDLMTSGVSPDLANTWAVVPASNYTAFFPSQQGIELFGGWNGPGGKGGLSWAAGVVNGSPTDMAVDNFTSSTYPRVGSLMNMSAIKDGVESAFTGKMDVNGSKDYYARLQYKLGGMGVLGSSSQEASLKMAQNWQDPSVTFGTFFYRGVTGAFDDITAPVFSGAGANYGKNSNRFWRYGGEITGNWWNLQLTGAATLYRDKVQGGVWALNRDGTRVQGWDFDTNIYTAKLDYVALPWLVPSFRFENVNPDYDVADWKSFNRYSALVSALVRANVKVTFSGVFVGNQEGERIPALDNSYNLGLQFDF
ncbi:MAG: hypothetical protein A3D89_03310 [Planctomycetes bacterium RIFCSPHIGHO2_02_FULL_52_58]|nr:MAG: hypothetical protein A3D89_03310 [Planctomycetes bacterium RIFCSPHIGHO2_02_FULL_52_58]